MDGATHESNPKPGIRRSAWIATKLGNLILKVDAFIIHRENQALLDQSKREAELNRTLSPSLINLSVALAEMLIRKGPKNRDGSANACDSNHQVDRRNILRDYLWDDYSSKYPRRYSESVIAEFRDSMLHPYRVGAALYVFHRLSLRTELPHNDIAARISRNHADKVTAIVIGGKEVYGAASEAKNLARERSNCDSTSHYLAALFAMVGKPFCYANPSEAFDRFLNNLRLDDISDSHRDDDNENIVRFFSIAKVFDQFSQEHALRRKAVGGEDDDTVSSGNRKTFDVPIVPTLIDNSQLLDAETLLRTIEPPYIRQK